jgi:hypothetical protein
MEYENLPRVTIDVLESLSLRYKAGDHKSNFEQAERDLQRKDPSLYELVQVLSRSEHGEDKRYEARTKKAIMLILQVIDDQLVSDGLLERGLHPSAPSESGIDPK